MPRVRMLRGKVGEDRTDWLPGTEHDASVEFARSLVAGRAAVILDGPLPAAPPLTTNTIENRAIQPESRDPRPRGGKPRR